jgi:hypothetical protein
LVYAAFSAWPAINCTQIADCCVLTLIPHFRATQGLNYNAGALEWHMTKKAQHGPKFILGRSGLYCHIGEHLDRSAIFKVTDERDKIIAIQGLVDPRYRIVPDYKQDLSTIQAEVTKRIIEVDGSLKICRY